LTEEQRDELAEIELAERLYPDRYKGAKKKLVEFYRRFDAEATKMEDPDENPDFKRLMDTKPKISQLDYKKVQREIGKREATQAVRDEIAPELEKIKIEQAEIKARPKVAAVLTELETDLNKMFVDDANSPMRDLAKRLADNQADAVSEYPLEAAVAQAELRRSRALLAEYTLFQNRATKFDPNNRAHTELYSFIESEGEALQKAGGMTRGGKAFLPLSAYAAQVEAIGQEAASRKFFTFGPDDVKELIKRDAKIRIESHVKRKLDEIKQYGFDRKPKAGSAAPPNPAPPEPAPTPTPTPTPRATPTRSKGAAAGDPPAPTSSIDVVGTLGMKRGSQSAS
jgi:hypothetical protein